MKAKSPLRILNEPSGILGLTSLDLCALGYVLVLLHGLFELGGFGYLAFPSIAVLAYLLIAIRTRFRRKTIRDFLAKLVSPEVIHDPET
jgi:hypothetical protein